MNIDKIKAVSEQIKQLNADIKINGIEAGKVHLSSAEDFTCACVELCMTPTVHLTGGAIHLNATDATGYRFVICILSSNPNH